MIRMKTVAKFLSSADLSFHTYQWPPGILLPQLQPTSSFMHSILLLRNTQHIV